MVCDVRGVGEALAAVPEGQSDASAGDFVSRVEFFGNAGNASKRTENVPVGIVESLGSDAIRDALEEEGNPRTGAQPQQQIIIAKYVIFMKVIFF